MDKRRYRIPNLQVHNSYNSLFQVSCIFYNNHHLYHRFRLHIPCFGNHTNLPQYRTLVHYSWHDMCFHRQEEGLELVLQEEVLLRLAGVVELMSEVLQELKSDTGCPRQGGNNCRLNIHIRIDNSN